jgi:hypothetical protein
MVQHEKNGTEFDKDYGMGQMVKYRSKGTS